MSKGSKNGAVDGAFTIPIHVRWPRLHDIPWHEHFRMSSVTFWKLEIGSSAEEPDPLAWHVEGNEL